MARIASGGLRQLPSVDEVLRTATAAATIERFGRSAVVSAVRRVISQSRAGGTIPGGTEEVINEAAELLEAREKPGLRVVFNLTGTVLHTNLGRALLAESAIEVPLALSRRSASCIT
jgi:L-seryl-tRNA(Ser) seleniumtransferase